MSRSANSETAIDELLAKQEIHEVLMRYCRGVNRLDMDLVRSCFHLDGHEDHGGFRGTSGEFCDLLGDALSSAFVSTMHFVGNELVEFSGDRAQHEAYFIAYDRMPSEDSGPEKDIVFGGRYLAILERRNGGPWLIAERIVIHDFSRIDLVEPWPDASEFVQGKQGLNQDLVFHLLHNQAEDKP
jgi:hypothetical protein